MLIAHRRAVYPLENCVQKWAITYAVLYTSQLDSSNTYVAKLSTNSCGKVITRVIVENEKISKVSQNNFDIFVEDYNNACGNCLFKVYQGGNSPLFAKEIPAGKSFMIENINGTLTLRELSQ